MDCAPSSSARSSIILMSRLMKFSCFPMGVRMPCAHCFSSSRYSGSPCVHSCDMFSISHRYKGSGQPPFYIAGQSYARILCDQVLSNPISVKIDYLLVSYRGIQFDGSLVLGWLRVVRTFGGSQLAAFFRVLDYFGRHHAFSSVHKFFRSGNDGIVEGTKYTGSHLFSDPQEQGYVKWLLCPKSSVATEILEANVFRDGVECLLVTELFACVLLSMYQ